MLFFLEYAWRILYHTVMPSGFQIAALLLCMPLLLSAARVPPQDALEKAERWLQQGRTAAGHRHGHRAMRPARHASGRVRTCSVDGTNLFHLVSIEGGGFVTISADESLPSVMGFSSSGELPDSDANNPFWALVGADAMAGNRSDANRRTSRKTSRRRGAPIRRFAFADTSQSRPRSAAPSAAGTATRSGAGVSSLDDVRVEPLVKSKWDQRGVGGKKTYNYYTPNGWYCGCVATAIAQLMRFHCFPSNSVSPQTFTCYTNPPGNSMTLLPMDLTMKGSVYDWASMPLVPTSSITDTQREAIGRICYDAGVSVRMCYASGGSSAILAFALDPLKNVFGYANACGFVISDDEMSLSELDIKNGILANLDAGYPAMLGICHMAANGDAYDGHAIIADGYGYLDGILYCHLNMGWSGSHDYWYALPNIGAGYNFNSVLQLAYNVFPDRTGELVSGRIANSDGRPCVGATVTASFSYKKGWRQYNTTETAMTNTNGIYAIFAPTGVTCSVTLSAVHGSWHSTNITTVTKASASPYAVNFETGNYSYTGSGLTIGNSWGNDFTYDPPPAFRMIFR